MITINKTTTALCTLSAQEAKEVTIQYLRKLAGYGKYTSFADHAGVIIREDWIDTGHGSGITNEREATELEIAVCTMLSKISEVAD